MRSDREDVAEVVVESGAEPNVEPRDRDTAIAAEDIVGGVAELGVAAPDEAVRLELAERNVPTEIEVQRPQVPIARVRVAESSGPP